MERTDLRVRGHDPAVWLVGGLVDMIVEVIITDCWRLIADVRKVDS